jgi:nucleoid-associated protein YgaU
VNEVGAIADTLDDLVLSQMQALNTLVEKLGDAAASVNKLINLPSSATRRIVATLSSVIAQARAIGDSFELQPFADQHRKAQRADGFGGTSTRNAALTKTGPAGNVDASASSRVTAVETIDRADVAHRAKRAARAVAAMAALRRAQMMYALETDILDIYTAKSGDNLRDVAFKISRNADEWKKIMLFNGLSTPALTAGQVVLVPKSSSEGFCASILP